MITVGVTEFAKRHLKPDFGGTRLTSDQMKLCRSITEDLLNVGASKEGYAPFCRTVSVHSSQIPDVLSPVVRINEYNEHYLRTEYRARAENELPVLVRYFTNEEVRRSPAHHLNVILYSREQLEAEDKATGQSDFLDAAWGIVAVNAEPSEVDSPMPPITMMRNALGKAEGGSGFPLDHNKYLEAVRYWSTHAQVE
jgi:hypothetical protein